MFSRNESRFDIKSMNVHHLTINYLCCQVRPQRCVVLWLVLLLWGSVIREDIAVSWGKQWGFVIIDKKYVFMNILLKVFYQEETVHSLLSVQNWQEMLQSKRVLLSIVYRIRFNVYYRHTCLVKVFHTYPHLAQSLKQ
jgi:hypothetical protein